MRTLYPYRQSAGAPVRFVGPDATRQRSRIGLVLAREAARAEAVGQDGLGVPGQVRADPETADVGLGADAPALGEAQDRVDADQRIDPDASDVSVRLGDGAGGFSGTTSVAVGNFAGSVALGDLNGSGGLPDLGPLVPNPADPDFLL